MSEVFLPPPCEGGSERRERGVCFFPELNPPFAFGSLPPSQGGENR